MYDKGRFVQAQVSLYPLRLKELSSFIQDAIYTFRDRGLLLESGPMSTLIGGQVDEVFDALREVFCKTMRRADVVMVATLSNGCPRYENGGRTDRQQEGCILSLE